MAATVKRAQSMYDHPPPRLAPTREDSYIDKSRLAPGQTVAPYYDQELVRRTWFRTRYLNRLREKYAFVNQRNEALFQETVEFPEHVPFVRGRSLNAITLSFEQKQALKKIEELEFENPTPRQRSSAIEPTKSTSSLAGFGFDAGDSINGSIPSSPVKSTTLFLQGPHAGETSHLNAIEEEEDRDEDDGRMLHIAGRAPNASADKYSTLRKPPSAGKTADKQAWASEEPVVKPRPVSYWSSDEEDDDEGRRNTMFLDKEGKPMRPGAKKEAPTATNKTINELQMKPLSSNSSLRDQFGRELKPLPATRPNNPIAARDSLQAKQRKEIEEITTLRRNLTKRGRNLEPVAEQPGEKVPVTKFGDLHERFNFLRPDRVSISVESIQRNEKELQEIKSVSPMPSPLNPRRRGGDVAELEKNKAKLKAKTKGAAVVSNPAFEILLVTHGHPPDEDA